MGRKCSVQNCGSDSTKREHAGVTYHKVPLHTDIRPKWISLCRIPEEENTSKVLYVCSRHFLRADFCNFKGKKYMLRQGVLPSVFPWDKSKLHAIKAEVTIKKEVEVAPKKGQKTKSVPKQRKKKLLGNAAEVSQPAADVKVEIKQETEDAPDGGPSAPINETLLDTLKHEIKSEVAEESDSKQEISVPQTDPFDQHQMSQNTPAATPISFNIGSRIEVLDNNSVWQPAKVNEVDYEESEVLIHFEKSSNKYKEWIPMASPRLRPVQPKVAEKFEIGERCMAYWCDNRKFPAQITKALDNDMYEVLFDDGFIKLLRSARISKMSVTKPAPASPSVEYRPLNASPLFDPVQGTKQDRREKKRKLNVAELFTVTKTNKRPKSGNSEKKRKTSPTVTKPLVDEICDSPASQDEGPVPEIIQPKIKWHPSWQDGKPVGIESAIEGADGLRTSYIVPDPRLPQDWAKHLTQKIHGNSVGKWDTIIMAPDGKKFRNKNEIKNYIELHPKLEVSLDMFDFSLYRSGSRKKRVKNRQSKVKVTDVVPSTDAPVQNKEEPLAESTIAEEAIVDEVKQEPVSEEEEEEEGNSSALKIVFENDAYKCPIEGCDKNFRRENLALMHVKHYHPEYTKYLESTPNVADLAYARTVGENLDRSPGPKSGEPKKIGLPASMYPDIKLKDLLGKNEELSMRDDINIKNLCSSRPSYGIKTLLPVRHSIPSTSSVPEEKPASKRKRNSLDNSDPLKGKHPRTTQQQPQPPSLINPYVPPPPQSPPHTTDQPPPPPPLDTDTTSNTSTLADSSSAPPEIPSAFDLAPPPPGMAESTVCPPTVTQFDGVIIEGGQIIKIERMKQEEIINCTCGYSEEDGLMIQCELCLCWQHAYCNNIQTESEVPDKYVCYICQNPSKERRGTRYLHDQDWLKQGVLPVASYHSKDSLSLEKRFDKLKKCHDISGGLLELKEYMHTLAVKLKVAKAKNHPKLYLWSKPWAKPKLPEKSDSTDPSDIKPKLENPDHEYLKNSLDVDKRDSASDPMLMMILKSGKEDGPMLNNSNAPIIPKPEAPIDSDDCKLNLLDHIAHAESLVEERLDEFERRMDQLEEGVNLESDADYPRTRQTLQMLIRDLNTVRKFSELPMI
ncbi:PHD finger protein 20 isoform X2 [Anthonomus grandis grandis]|uniref:PHD finger protein 20 isoform X2 n=1 Tax=Anthonomus grandis grandis TaxID=2921223 RepID=UPI0021659436|nr:PHD finger protein 20 isoform X2 [Anthonomus grandis grandis]